MMMMLGTGEYVILSFALSPFGMAFPEIHNPPKHLDIKT